MPTGRQPLLTPPREHINTEVNHLARYSGGGAYAVFRLHIRCKALLTAYCKPAEPSEVLGGLRRGVPYELLQLFSGLAAMNPSFSS
jgi:hypothetical protein